MLEKSKEPKLQGGADASYMIMNKAYDHERAILISQMSDLEISRLHEKEWNNRKTAGAYKVAVSLDLSDICYLFSLKIGQLTPDERPILNSLIRAARKRLARTVKETPQGWE